MRTIKSLLAAIMTVVMIVCMSVSAFAAYEEIIYDDVHDMYGATLSEVNLHYIRFVDKLGIITAHNNGSFDPSGKLTRGEALKIAYRMLHYGYDELADYESTATSFDELEGGDLADTSMILPYVAWGEDYQLVSGEYVPEKKFEADRFISGEEFITLITKTCGIATGEDNASEYEEFQTIILEGSEVDASVESINREQAAIIVARAMLYDANVGTVDSEMFSSFRDFDGNLLNCLATNIYGCNITTLTIRATENRPMNYEGVTKEVLLSNGVQTDIGADLSEFVGYNIDVIYLDKDHSGTFTEDEELITYQIASPIVNKVPLTEISVNSFSSLSGTSTSSTYAIYSNTMLYLNDDIWPLGDVYNLTKAVSVVNFKTPTLITGRPNLELTFIQHGTAENADVVLATEWIPGKLMTVTDNYISVYSYYDGSVHVYDDNDIVFKGIANPQSGDYVNFYLASGKLHLSAGTEEEMEKIAVTTVNGIDGIRDSAAENPTKYYAHSFVNKPTMKVKEVVGPVVAVLDSTRTTYLAYEEKKATEDVAVEILDITANANTAKVKVRAIDGGKESDLTVDLARISSKDGVIDKGDLYTYYVTAGEKVVMEEIAPVKTVAIETKDYFILDGGRKVLKTEGYISDTEGLKSGEVVLYMDAYDGVWASYEA
ncbi:MAG: hypothetical protein IKK30_06280 [Clostridia bacterium]|nr:hypothetical protein [Clostridia bacterium]